MVRKILLLGLGFLFLFLLLVKTSRYTYRAVLPVDVVGPEKYFLPTSVIADEKKYVVFEGHLYLAYQKVITFPFLFTYVSKVDWTLEELGDIKRGHPEFELMWNQNQSGVEWIN